MWKASEVDGEIAETARTQVGGLTVDWVRIERPDFLLTTFWGTAELPNGRQLDIEVHQIMSDPELSKRIFNRILTNLKFTDNPLLEAGAEVVTTMKNKGLVSYLNDQNQRMLYLIKDSAERPVGFTIEFLVDSGKEYPLNVKGASFLYIGGQNTLEQETSFQCSNNLNAFTYLNRIDSREGRSGTQTALDESGTLSVKKFGLSPDKGQYYPGAVALPDVFFGHIFQQMLDSDKREIVVDLIDADGRIIPTYITGIESENPQAAYVFDLDILDGRGFSQRVFLDKQRHLYKSLIQQKNLYIIERASAEEIINEFPERASSILQNSRML